MEQPAEQSGHAHVYRIRLDAEGTSATAIEQYFGLVTARIQRGTELPMHVAAQVIEMADNGPACEGGSGDTKAPYVGVWYRGRLTLAPELTAQGCNEAVGDRVAYGDASVPAVHVFSSG